MLSQVLDVEGLPSYDVYSAQLSAGHGSVAQASVDVASPRSIASLNHHSSPSLSTTDLSLKRKRSRFSIRNEPVVRDFVQEGLLSQLQAVTCFDAFFRGCNRFVPCFDDHDTFPAIRDRSSLLFNAICAVGCGVSDDLDVDCRMLYAHLKRWLTIVILNSHTASLETVQALLVSFPLHSRNLRLKLRTDYGLLDAREKHHTGNCDKDRG